MRLQSHSPGKSYFGIQKLRNYKILKYSIRKYIYEKINRKMHGLINF